MVPGPVSIPPSLPPRPVEDCYWVLPGRLLVGAHPGSRSRAQAMERLRRFLECGVTCFIDLTEPDETTSYESMLPFQAPDGRRVEYLREPIVDHGVPASRETMARILAMLDAALESGHLVYLHCRAGIGRSAMAVACWLARRTGDAERALAELAEAWPQAVQSEYWSQVPETEQQRQFVLDWLVSAPSHPGVAADARQSAPSLQARLRGAWFGLALGDAWGDAHARGETGGGALAWTQHTALTLCTAESLFELGRFDARDQLERFVRWQRAGHCSATGTAPDTKAVTPDVAKALATFLWRRLPMAGSHDPDDAAATSVPRALAAVSFALADPPAAVALAAECSRPTHQSPVILDACRLHAATLVGALRAQPSATWLEGLPVTTPPCFASARLHKDVMAAATNDGKANATLRAGVPQALAHVRRIVASAASFEVAMQEACAAGGKQAALLGALVGALLGAWQGDEAIPAAQLARLLGSAQLETVAARSLAHLRKHGVAA